MMIAPANQSSDDGRNGNARRQEVFRVGLIKTKTNDGGSHEASDGVPDKFALFSNRNSRMMHLLGLADQMEHEEDDEVWRRLTGYQGAQNIVRVGAHAQGNSRETKLSTELHPSAFYRMIVGDL